MVGAFVNNVGATTLPETSTFVENSTVSNDQSFVEPSELNSALPLEEETPNIDINQLFQPESNSTENDTILTRKLMECKTSDIPECSNRLENDKKKLPKNAEIRKRQSSNKVKKISKRSYCTECKIWIRTNHFVYHVVAHHYSKRALICSLCNFTDKWFISHMKTHFRKAHPGRELKFVDKREELKPEIKKIGNSIKMTYPRPHIINENVKRYYCKGCQTSIRATGWWHHIIGRHFSKRALICSLCDFQDKWHLSHMKTHFEAKHPEKEVKFIDKRDEFKPEIRKIGNSLKVKFSTKKVPLKDLLYCKECETRVEKKRWSNHVLAEHYTKEALTCSLCGFGEKWYVTRMKEHFEKSHPGEEIEFIDRKKEMRPELKKIGNNIKMNVISE